MGENSSLNAAVRSAMSGLVVPQNASKHHKTSIEKAWNSSKTVILKQSQNDVKHTQNITKHTQDISRGIQIVKMAMGHREMVSKGSKDSAR